MKCCPILLTFAVCSVLHGAEVSTNHLSIHLLADKAGWNGTAKPDGLAVMAHPILGDADFVAFDTTNDTFTHTAEAAKPLVIALAHREVSFVSSGETFYAWDGGDTPFVLQASGQAIYVGVFCSPFSSHMYAGLPVITPCGGFVVKTGTNAVFQIDCGFSSPRQGADELAIAPSGWFSTDHFLEDYLRKTDVRKDSRIDRAVQQLFAHGRR
jgi:hypothetical protein